MQDWKMQDKNRRTQKWTTNNPVSVAPDYILYFREESTINNELQRIIYRKKHRKHQLTSYVVQRIEYFRKVYRQLQFTSVRQFSRTASLSSASANDIEDSRSPKSPLNVRHSFAQGNVAQVFKRVVLKCSLHSLQTTHSFSDSLPYDGAQNRLWKSCIFQSCIFSVPGTCYTCIMAPAAVQVTEWNAVEPQTDAAAYRNHGQNVTLHNAPG